MGRTQRAKVTALRPDLGTDGPTSTRVEVEVPRPGSVATARALSYDDSAKIVEVEVGGRSERAQVDASVETVVILTAITRAERLIVERHPQGWIVVGALRTTATPGVDRGEEFHIAAKRLKLEGEHDLRLVSGGTSLIMRAAGHLELFAKNITSRAAGVHKLVGRMLHLN